jgi:hypothetical protein
MKRYFFPSTWIILIILFSLSTLDSLAEKSKATSAGTQSVNTTYDDSLSMMNAAEGDVFIVDSKDFDVYVDKDEFLTKGPLEANTLALHSGDKFKILKIERLKVKLGALVQLPDSSRAYVINLVTLTNYCYKQGTSPVKGRITRSLDSMIRFSHKTFWIVLGITLLVSALFLIFLGKLDKYLYKVTGNSQKVNKPGIAFLAGSAIFGALTGLSVLFYDTKFKNFVLNLPELSYPSEAGFIDKYYWWIQVLFFVFFAWAVFRSIREFGPKAGIVRSLILLIPAFTIFWTALATSFIALVGAIVMIFMSGMASDLEKGPQASTMIKEETQTFTGEKRTVKVNYDAQGNMKSKKYI